MACMIWKSCSKACLVKQISTVCIISGQHEVLRGNILLQTAKSMPHTPHTNTATTLPVLFDKQLKNWSLLGNAAEARSVSSTMPHSVLQ